MRWTNAFFNRWMGAEKIDQGTPVSGLTMKRNAVAGLASMGSRCEGIVQLLPGLAPGPTVIRRWLRLVLSAKYSRKIGKWRAGSVLLQSAPGLP
jgi:hypothetical protein